MSTPSIPEFFSGQNVLVTGFTGFMGKVLVEKLLRSCPDIGDMYLLVRGKRGKPPNERIEEIARSELFEKLRQKQPGFTDKLKPVIGEVSELGLGLDPQVRTTLINNVNIVFHVAASVRFDDTLRNSIILNTRGTRETVHLALKMKNLKIFVHISTGYCNIDQEVIEEKLYPPHGDWRKMIQAMEKMDPFPVEVLSNKITGALGNNYVYSKSMAEHVVNDMCHGKVPVVIFRPTIVLPIMSDPLPGWVDNFNGPIGLMIGQGKGIIRTMYSNPDRVLDLMPVDIATRGMISATWLKYTSDTSKSTEVYNCGYDGLVENHVTTRHLQEWGAKLGWEVPLNNPIWHPHAEMTKSKLWYYINVLLFHLLPAVVIDGILRLLRKKPMLTRLQRRIYTTNMLLDRFMINEWDIVNEKFRRLNDHLKACDKKDFSIEQVKDPYLFFKNGCMMARKLLLKESEDTLPQAKVQHFRLYVLHKVVRVVIYFIASKWLWRTISSAVY